MDLGFLDPALFAPQVHRNPLSPSAAHQDSLSFQPLDNLPRLPNQIGGVTTANAQTYSYAPHDPYTLPSPPRDRVLNTLTHIHPYTYHAQRQQNGFDLHIQNSQQTLDSSHQATASGPAFLTRPIITTGYPTPPQSQESSAGHIINYRIADNGGVAELPKFHCGEKGCKVFRTDGLNHNGRYAMSKHYKKDHPHLQFDFHRLVSSQTGQKSFCMLPKRKNKREKRDHNPNSTEDAESPQLQDVPLDPTLTTVPAPNFTHSTQHENIKINTQVAQSHSSSQVRLPCMVGQPFTHVPDLRIPERETRMKTSALRRACDVETLKVRKLLLSHCCKTGRSDHHFSVQRKKLFNGWIQKARGYLAWIDEPLDSRFGEIGSHGDIVYEVGSMFFYATRRSYLPQTGVMPDGSTLSGDEFERRRLLCELRAMELCLDFCREMSHTCGQFLEIKRMFSQQNLPPMGFNY